MWVSIGPTSETIAALAIDPRTPSIVYAGSDGDGIFRSTNSGESWSKVTNGLTDLYVSAIVIDPATPKILYIGTRESGVFKSTNSGESWSAVNTSLPCPYIFSLAIDPITPTTIYAGTLCGVFKSLNGGENWSVINTGMPDTFVFTLVIDPLKPTTIYAGTEDNRPPPANPVMNHPYAYRTYAIRLGIAFFLQLRNSYSNLPQCRVFAQRKISGVTRMTNRLQTT